MSRRRIFSLPLLAALLLTSVGCSAFQPRATRDLSEAELVILNRLEKRLKENKKSLGPALDGLYDDAAEALADQHSLSLSISKAQLLETLESPWRSTSSASMSATQREVALYHLFQLTETERELLDARLRERRVAVGDLREAYGQLITLTGQLIKHEKLILAYLNEPAKARIAPTLGVFLQEVKAFRENLAQSSHPKLQALAREVEKTEGRIEQLQGLLLKVVAADAEQPASTEEN